MNPELNLLQPYPFEKLTRLKDGITPPAELAHIALSIGEPRHQAPAFALTHLSSHLQGLSSYPLSKGQLRLRQVISQWLEQRFHLPGGSIDAENQVIPVTGTREALFAFAQAVIDRQKKPLVMMPNPFYQIYEGAALLAGAEPFFLNTTAENNYLPDFDQVTEDQWQRCQLLYICSPGNPTGAVIDTATLQKLIRLAEKHDFIIASDECYSEIYFDENQPPVGLLQAAAEMGHDDYRRCVVFHSLSKRSNLPGLRSGFVAGDAEVLGQFLKYRTYHGCAMPPHHQDVSIPVWQDEQHVIENRKLYREKFERVIEILSPVIKLSWPDAGFYLWPKLDMSDEDFTRDLFAQQNVTVLPGSYLSRDTVNGNPGRDHVRMALVATPAECQQAARRIRAYLENRG